MYENILKEYRNRIDLKARLTAKAKKKIACRLKEYTEDELIEAIKAFSSARWWMEHCGLRGIAWFCHSEDRIEQFMKLKPNTKLTVTIV